LEFPLRDLLTEHSIAGRRDKSENTRVPHLWRSDFSCGLPTETDAAVFCGNIATARHASIGYKKREKLPLRKYQPTLQNGGLPQKSTASAMR